MRRAFTPLSALILAAGLATWAGCPANSQCNHVGDTCTFSCCLSEGLQCRAGASGGRCTKTCHCHGTAICAPSSFNDGCPQGSVCLANETDGTGECVVLCDNPPCEVGRYSCQPTDGGAIACVAVDASVPDLQSAPGDLAP